MSYLDILMSVINGFGEVDNDTMLKINNANAILIGRLKCCLRMNNVSRVYR